MNDIFEEAEDGLRRDKWVDIAKKSAPWVGGIAALALVAALGFWGYSSWQDSKTAEASELYAAAQKVEATGDRAKATAEYKKVADGGTAAYKALALLKLGGLALEDNKTDEAIAHFDAAAKATSAPLITDIAALKAAYLVMDKAPFSEVQKRLEPLAKEGRPYAPMAREALAMAKIQSGDLQGARGDLQALSLSLDAPEGVKRRAQETIAAIDSGAAEVARASLKLPEVTTVAMPEGMGALEMPVQ